jgi:predicted ATPase
MTCWSRGDFIEDRHYLEKAIAASDPERDKRLALRFQQDPGVSALYYLALVLFGLGHIDRARSLTEEAIGRAMGSGHLPTLVYAHFLKCVFEALQRNPERAAPHANALVTLAQEHGMPLWTAFGSFFNGWARSCAGDQERGMAQLRYGMILCREQEVMNFIALMVAVQAAAEADAGNLSDGLALIDAFLAETQPIKQPWFDAELHRQRGTLLLRRAGAASEAVEAAFHHALAIARSQQTRTFELRAAVALARLWLDQGKRREAYALLAPVYGCFTEGFDTKDLQEAKSLLAEPR